MGAGNNRILHILMFFLFQTTLGSACLSKLEVTEDKVWKLKQKEFSLKSKKKSLIFPYFRGDMLHKKKGILSHYRSLNYYPMYSTFYPYETYSRLYQHLIDEKLKHKKLIMSMKANKKAHQKKMVPIFKTLSIYHQKNDIQKKNYADNYHGSVREKKLIYTYATSCTTFGILKGLGNHIKQDDIRYPIEDSPELKKWMLYQQKRVSADYEKHQRNLKTIRILELLLEGGVKVNSNLNKIARFFLPPNYIKTLMAKKNKVTSELKRRIAEEKSLPKQLLSKRKNIYPPFSLKGEGYVLVSLSKNIKNISEEHKVNDKKEDRNDNSIVFVDLVMGKEKSNPEKGKRRSQKKQILKNPLSALLDPKKTYMYDKANGKYILANPEEPLPNFLITLKKEIKKGYLYNGYKTYLSVFGEGAGYVFVGKDGNIQRKYHTLKKSTTRFTSSKKGV